MSGLIERAVEKVLLGSATNEQSDFGTRHKIVVCQRGFVYAGDVSEVGEYVVIENAVNVRRWGTTRGLGQLAASGMQKDTKCDSCGTVRVHKLAVVSLIDCKEIISATA